MKALIRSVLSAVIFSAISSKADTYDFYAITSYTNSGYQSVVNQLSMDVVSPGETSAVLTFSNAGLVDATVALICFAYGSETYGLTAEASGWTLNEAPPGLPGGDGLFLTDSCLKANAPSTKNGITSGSSLDVVLNYELGFDLLTALSTGDLRIGLHTIGIPDTEGRLVGPDDPAEEGNVGDPWTYSESSINVIPEPASLVLFTAAASFIVFIRRRSI